MSRTLRGDVAKLLLSLAVGPVAWAGLAFVVVAWMGYCSGGRNARQDIALVEAKARVET
jgi:hypothetical protein